MILSLRHHGRSDGAAEGMAFAHRAPILLSRWQSFDHTECGGGRIECISKGARRRCELFLRTASVRTFFLTKVLGQEL